MMLAGVRPTMRLASAPMASTRLVLASMATTDGSLMTIPRSRTWTSVLAVPRSIPMSREKRPSRRSNMAERTSSVGGRAGRRVGVGTVTGVEMVGGCGREGPAVYPRVRGPPRTPAGRYRARGRRPVGP